MIILRKDILTMWLKTIRRNQTWLAKEMGLTKGYISQIANNRCKISREVIEGILIVTKFQFEHIFIIDGTPDTREFYGDTFVVDGKPMQKKVYYEKIRSKNRLDKNYEIMVKV